VGGKDLRRQQLQERLVFDAQTYVDHNLVRHMQSRGAA
jgi:hypothetical protein